MFQGVSASKPESPASKISLSQKAMTSGVERNLSASFQRNTLAAGLPPFLKWESNLSMTRSFLLFSPTKTSRRSAIAAPSDSTDASGDSPLRNSDIRMVGFTPRGTSYTLVETRRAIYFPKNGLHSPRNPRERAPFGRECLKSSLSHSSFPHPPKADQEASHGCVVKVPFCRSAYQNLTNSQARFFGRPGLPGFISPTPY